MNITSSNEKYGGWEFLLNNLNIYLPYTVICSLVTITGTVGNLVIIAAIIDSKELQTNTNALIFNLALSDLFISGIVDLFAVVGVLRGEEFFSSRPILCEVLAAICLIICVTSLINMLFLAFNRFIYICYRNAYKIIFSRKATMAYCLLTWVIGVLMDLPLFFGWGDHYYDLKTLSCIWNRLASRSYTIFFSTTVILVPCFGIAFFYLRIFIFVMKAKSRTMSHAVNKKISNKFNASIKVAKGLFCSYFLFTICWVPYALTVMLDFNDLLPNAAHMYPLLIAHANSSLNPILYALTNPKFQRGYKNLFRKLICKKKISKTTESFSPTG